MLLCQYTKGLRGTFHITEKFMRFSGLMVGRKPFQSLVVKAARQGRRGVALNHKAQAMLKDTGFKI